jgi:hypothetical protein
MNIETNLPGGDPLTPAASDSCCTSVAACCAPETQETCCEPTQQADCCGTFGGDCGCR